ncbi:hypothetical protein D7147_03115 [Micromonospora musae]|uniref:Uncharacterized protein n=2 Tax=Micromonospora musae TaxID=1894970 RepID=A0A3A9Y1J6_9ACTN|nr:hypothetical protein D7147_03115 [Micromonospora musae]RKN31670.1 hypothetical protein D7044_15280 [Micromonospora musae]
MTQQYLPAHHSCRECRRGPSLDVMGHEQASTTLNRYTHTPDDYAVRVLDAFTLPADDLLTPAEGTNSESTLDEDEEGL